MVRSLIALSLCAGGMLQADSAMTWLGDNDGGNGLGSSAWGNASVLYEADRQFVVNSPGDFTMSSVVNVDANTYLCQSLAGCGKPGIEAEFQGDAMIEGGALGIFQQSLSGSGNNPGNNRDNIFYLFLTGNAINVFTLAAGTYTLHQDFFASVFGDEGRNPFISNTFATHVTPVALDPVPEPRYLGLGFLAFSFAAIALFKRQ